MTSNVMNTAYNEIKKVPNVEVFGNATLTEPYCILSLPPRQYIPIMLIHTQSIFPPLLFASPGALWLGFTGLKFVIWNCVKYPYRLKQGFSHLQIRLRYTKLRMLGRRHEAHHPPWTRHQTPVPPSTCRAPVPVFMLVLKACVSVSCY